MSYDIFQTKFRSYHRIYATTYNHCTLYVYVYDPGWALSPLLTPMRTIAALKLVVWKCAIGGSTYFPRDEDLISPPGWLISFLCQSRTVELQPRNWTTGRPIDLIRRCAWTRVTVSASCRPVSGHLLLLGEKKVFSNALAGCLPQLAASHARRRDFFMNRSAHLTLNRPAET